ncbi:MAG: universal stress protein UspA [Tissierellia bacterium]|nr:universal stress protein UspA [Tissierellia bacterium]
MNNTIMVCVTQQRTCEKLIKKGAALRKNEGDELIIINAVNENDKFLNLQNDSEALEYLFEIAKEVDGELQVIRTKNVLDNLISFAKDNNVDYVILGHTNEENKVNVFYEKFNEKLPFTEIIEV